MYLQNIVPAWATLDRLNNMRHVSIAKRSKKSYAISLILAFVIGTIHDIGYSRGKCESLYCPEDEVVLSGDYYKAISAAAKDFQQVVRRSVRNRKSELGLFLLDIKNYLIFINIEPDGNFLINFHPKNFKDSPIKGGGATYKVSSATFELLEKEYSM